MITPKEHTKRLCLIPLCKNERFDLVHKFPMDNQRAEEWRRAINIPEINNLSLDVLRKRTICSKHFRKEDYKNVESRSLNKTAVPSLNFRTAEHEEKSNFDTTIKCPPTLNATCQSPVLQNKRRPVKPSTNSNLSITSTNVDNSDQRRRHLFKYVYSSDNATPAVPVDEGPSSKYRFIDLNQLPNIQTDDSHLDLISVAKATDDALVSVVNVDDSITLIDQSSQIDFLTKDAVDYIENADSYQDETIQQLESSYLSE